MSDYEIPEPSKDPVSALVVYYKVLKGVEYDDRGWDRIHFPRCLRASKSLLEICKDYEQSKRCIDELASKFSEIDCSWSLETIVKHAHEWRQRRGKKNDIQSRKRFFDALAQQRANGTTKTKGDVVTGGQILGPLRNLQVFQSDDGTQERGRDSKDGSVGEGPQQDSLEAKEA